MDFKKMLSQLSQLNEATKETSKGRVHKAEPGGYGRKFDTDEEGDEDKKGEKKEPAVKRGRGRPKKGADSETGQVAKYDNAKNLQSFMVGNLPKGKLPGKPGKKHSIKEWIEEVEAKHSRDVNEGIMDTVKGMFGGSKPSSGRLNTYTPSEYEFHVPFNNVVDGNPRAGTGPGHAAGAIWDKFNKLVRIVEPQGGKMYIYPKPELNQLGNLIIKVKSNLDAKTIKNELVKNNLFPADFAKGILVDPQKNYDYASRAGRHDVAENTPGQQLTVKPMPGAAQLVDPASNKVMATGDAAAVKNIQGAVAQGKVQMRGEEMAESDEDYSAKKARAGKDIGKPGKQFSKIAKSAGEKYGSEESGKKVAGAVLAKLRKKVSEADIPSDQSDMGAGLGAGRNAKTFEGKKPDFPDIDDDGNTKEPISKAAQDAEKKPKKKVSESIHKHNAARLLGKHHALAKEAYNCKYDDMEEARLYHEGYKEGLDECYGQGVYETAPAMPPATPGGMAGQAMPSMEEDMFDEGNAFTAALAKTPQGGKFTVGGKSFTDRSGYNAKIDEFAFESLDKQLNSLLSEDSVSEGMSVSISKGNQGAPDSVSVTAQDAEADQLLAIIKQSGLGLLGQEGSSDFGVPSDGAGAEKHGDINVVGDHDGMMSLIKKVTGASSGDEQGGNDYEDAEGHDEHEHEGHEHTEEGTCNECGYMESKCQCDEEAVMGEEESYDQEEEEVAEDNPPDSGAAETTADENAEAAEDQALATADEEQVTEWANDPGQSAEEFDEETFTTNEKFMNKTLAGGLNKPKSTGQTTVPVVASQMNRQMAYESILNIKRLAGIK